MNKEYTVKQGDNLTKIANRLGLSVKELIAANPGIDPNKIAIGLKLALPLKEPRKVNFSSYMTDTVHGGNRNRPMNISAMELLQDSLVARGFEEPLRLAILATAAQEMDENGAASKGVGGNGYLGLSSQRMPIEYLDDTEEGRGKLIHYILEDLTHVYTGTHPLAGNWLSGSSTLPKVVSGKDGYLKFFSASDPKNATIYLNKSYIRPASDTAWTNRASVAEGMSLHMEKNGGSIHIKKKNRGKFTDYCGGKVTEECIEKGKHSSNPTTRKRAIFADNARHFKHKNGGIINYLNLFYGNN